MMRSTNLLTYFLPIVEVSHVKQSPVVSMTLSSDEISDRGEIGSLYPIAKFCCEPYFVRYFYFYRI